MALLRDCILFPIVPYSTQRPDPILANEKQCYIIAKVLLCVSINRKGFKILFDVFHVLFGIKQLPAIRLYWSNDPLIGVLAVQKVMSRNRFDKLLKYFHLNNNAN